MLIKRLLFVVVGVLIAGLALSLVLWGLNALRSEPAGSSDATANSAAIPTPEVGGASGGESRQWQEFTGGAAQSSEQVAGPCGRSSGGPRLPGGRLIKPTPESSWTASGSVSRGSVAASSRWPSSREGW